jgi:hypothetical protein
MKIAVVSCYHELCNRTDQWTSSRTEGRSMINIGFGFGSCFDGDHFNLEICDSCFILEFAPKLAKQLKERDFNIDKIKDAMNNKEFSNNIK